MADPATPTTEPVATPSVEATPPVAPPVETSAAPAAEATSAPAAAPAPLPTDAPTLMESFEARKAAAETETPAETPAKETAAVETTAEAAPAETPAKEATPAETTPVTEAPPPTPPEPLKLEAVLPEGVVMSDDQRGQLETVLGNLRAEPTLENQQALLDMGVNFLREGMKDYDRQSHEAFYSQRQKWQREVMDDPIIGGGNHDEAMQAIAYVRDNFLSTAPRGSKEYEAARTSFDQALHYTGMGDNPHFLRFMHNISRALNEPQMQATQEIKPIVLTDSGGRPPIYKHPTSLRNGR